MTGVVCQIPGCKTTQSEIESELQSYLGGYCQACEKQREGRLCGCAFPCSLTFKGQMLSMIHNLIGLDYQQGIKQINVCYKHPELLKQAREKCISNRDGGSSSGSSEASRPERKNKNARVEKKPEEISFSLDSLGDSEAVLGLDSGGAGEVTGLDSAGTVTSIVYTDEGGRQQKMVGKIVYQTDEKGQSNIIIQEVDEGEESGEKLMKINLSDIDGYMQQMESKQVEEEMEQRLEEEMEGREARIEEELDLEASAGGETKVTEVGGFSQLGGNVIQLSDHHLDSRLFTGEGGMSVTEQGDTITLLESYTDPPPHHVTEPTFQVTAGPISPLKHKKLIPIFPKSSCPAEVVAVAAPVDVKSQHKTTNIALPGIIASPENEILKIQYKEYNRTILVTELAGLSRSEELCDTALVCGDGKVITSSLLLSPLIPWLSSLLDTVIRVDDYKTVILPREVSVSSVQLLVSLVTNNTRLSPSYTTAQLMSLKQVCSVLDCKPVLDLLAGVGLPVLESVKRKASSPLKRKVKHPRVSTAGSAIPGFASFPAGVKLEKTELNADYVDSSGLVRLSSSDEMAMHYCLLCEGKFKKYNQAITHYDVVHSLAAALSCDMCDNTFRDMYSCVKHKHEIHGQFDVNFQCYLCKEVLYSRFRLGTHIKECHKAQYGQFVCRACGMKFAAQYYLTIHQKESHSDSANTCNICNKTFSGKRYLTMHIKANHEAQYSAGDDQALPPPKDKIYQSRSEGNFEDSNKTTGQTTTQS